MVMKYIDLMPLDEALSDTDLVRRYNHYNKMLFDGKLPQIPIRYAKLKHAGGKVLYIMIAPDPRPNPVLIRLGRIGRYHGYSLKPGSLEMKISDTFSRSDEGLNSLMIHEMIHVYFASQNNFGVGHGDEFINMADKLGQIVGFKIPLKDDIDIDVMELNANLKPIYVVIKNMGTHFNFAIFGKSFIENNLFKVVHILEKTYEMNYAIGILAGVSNSEYWNKCAAILPVQRTFSRSTKWYRLPAKDKETAVVSLKQGKIDFKIGNI